MQHETGRTIGPLVAIVALALPSGALAVVKTFVRTRGKLAGVASEPRIAEARAILTRTTLGAALLATAVGTVNARKPLETRNRAIQIDFALAGDNILLLAPLTGESSVAVASAVVAAGAALRAQEGAGLDLAAFSGDALGARACALWLRAFADAAALFGTGEIGVATAVGAVWSGELVATLAVALNAHAIGPRAVLWAQLGLARCVHVAGVTGTGPILVALAIATAPSRRVDMGEVDSWVEHNPGAFLLFTVETPETRVARAGAISTNSVAIAVVATKLLIAGGSVPASIALAHVIFCEGGVQWVHADAVVTAILLAHQLTAVVGGLIFCVHHGTPAVQATAHPILVASSVFAASRRAHLHATEVAFPTKIANAFKSGANTMVTAVVVARCPRAIGTFVSVVARAGAIRAGAMINTVTSSARSVQALLE